MSDRILIVDAAHQAIAAAQFPSLLVLGNKPTDDATLSFDAGALSGKTVYLWCHYAALLAKELAPAVPDLGIVNGDKTPMSFQSQPGAALTYLRTNVRRYRPPTSKSDPWATPDNIAAPESVQAVVEASKPADTGAQKAAKAASATKLARKATRQRTEGTSWADFGLVLNDDGIPITTLDNCVHVIEQHPDLAGHVWYDSFLSKILHTWGVDVPREWTDYDDIRLALYMQRDIGIPRVSPTLVSDAVVCYAMREVRNCAYDWLDSLQWDGKERLCLLATLGFGAESNDYTAAVCRNLILAMVKRVFEPGCKSDYMPVFEGSQGVGKSKLLNILGGEWFAELHMDWNNKDFYCALQGKMLLEIGELHAFKQTDVDKIKGIVSCAVDRYREPFGRHTKDFPRQGVFAGTTNRDDWNRDDTGARRFWPVLCGTLDHEWVRSNRDQLFAEAVHVIRSGGSYWEVPWGDAQAQQDERRAADTWDDAVTAWLIGRNRCTLAEVMSGAVDLDAAHQTLSDQQRMGRVMKKMGWIKRNVKENGIQRKVWVNPLTLDLPEPPTPDF
jgi:predicted P-loop ATPase